MLKLHASIYTIKTSFVLMTDARKLMSSLLLSRDGYKDLVDEPVVLAGGLLGVYFANAEVLCPGGKGIVKAHGPSAIDMINAVWDASCDDEKFRKVVGFAAREISRKAPGASIGGGQRRDWIFSGAIARELGVDHIALYKDGRAQRITPSGEVFDLGSDASVLHGYDVVPVVDMLTEGSSCYSLKAGVESGWVPELRKRGAQVQELYAMLSRLQGGEENLARQRVEVVSLLQLDEDFLQEASGHPDVAIAYLRDPIGESQKYIQEQGVGFLVKYFAPDHSKPAKAARFLERFGGFLREEGLLRNLEREVTAAHGESWGFVGR